MTPVLQEVEMWEYMLSMGTHTGWVSSVQGPSSRRSFLGDGEVSEWRKCITKPTLALSLEE